MKKIINGKKYDTQTARYICSYQHSYPGDFSYCYEALYLKKTGEFFLYGEGGPMTEYSVAVGQNTWSGGEEIRPLTKREALKFAEKNMSADDFEEEFGQVQE